MNYSWTNTESLLIHFIAGLLDTDTERALIVFLTLGTSRSRVDLVERLAKRYAKSDADLELILGVTSRFAKLSPVRNRYNHCIYAFEGGEKPGAKSILMRIADRKREIKIGLEEDINEATIHDIEASIADIQQLNRDFWSVIRKLKYPV